MIQFTSIVQQADFSWLFAWTSTGAASYRVVLFGKQIGVANDPSFVFNLPGWETYAPQIEVVEAGQLALSELYSARITIQWYNSPDAAIYLLQEYDGTQWNQIDVVLQVPTLGAYTVQSPRLEDGSQHLYQVIAVGAAQQNSSAQQFQISVVTPPKWPDGSIQLAYDNVGHNIVVLTT